MSIDSEGYAQGFDYQCSYCHKIFHGPGANEPGNDPGYEIPSATHRRPLSHGTCKDCEKKQEKKRAREYYKYKKEHP